MLCGMMLGFSPRLTTFGTPQKITQDLGKVTAMFLGRTGYLQGTVGYRYGGHYEDIGFN